MLNLDTNILLRVVSGELYPEERALLEQDSWGISSIVLWEIERLRRSRKINYGLDDERIRQLLDGLRMWPISPDVCMATRSLDFRVDPADEIIAATSIAYNVPLLTRDMKLLGSKVVPLALR